jgi:hypothetical protein
VPNFTNEYAMRNTHVPPGLGARWRNNNPFFRECFIDELARRREGSVSFRRPPLQQKQGSRRADAVAKAVGWVRPRPGAYTAVSRWWILRELHRSAEISADGTENRRRGGRRDRLGIHVHATRLKRRSRAGYCGPGLGHDEEITPGTDG